MIESDRNLDDRAIGRLRPPPVYDARDIIGAARVIFNPGAENPELEATLEERGIPTLRACMLVLLSTGQF